APGWSCPGRAGPRSAGGRPRAAPRTQAGPPRPCPERGGSPAPGRPSACLDRARLAWPAPGWRQTLRALLIESVSSVAGLRRDARREWNACGIHHALAGDRAGQAAGGRALAAVRGRGLLLAGGTAPGLGLFRSARAHRMDHPPGRRTVRRRRAGGALAVPAGLAAAAVVGGGGGAA